MLRPRGGCLALLAALLCAGCVVVSPTPNAPTAALITATAPPTASIAPASATAIAIVTATPSDTPPASATQLPSAVPTASSTPPPTQASSTPIASETNTTASPSKTPPAATSPAATLAPTVPPQATALAVGITFFSISPQTINPGDSITLTWQATGQQAAIYREEPSGPLTDMRAVPLSGTLTIKTSDALRNRVDYVLFAGAGSSNASATVSAIIRCPDKYFFANPPAGCPAFPGTLEPMAVERFEHGVMIWVSGQNLIYILFADGASRGWANVPNTWAQGQPESDPSIVAPAGLFQPVRGFGAVWRSNDASSGRTTRARLGWATETESALTGGFQCDSTPKYSNCFISGPGGAVYELLPEFSAWKVWQGP